MYSPNRTSGSGDFRNIPGWASPRSRSPCGKPEFLILYADASLHDLINLFTELYLIVFIINLF